MNDYIIISLLVLILFGNSRYGTRTMNFIERKANTLRKSVRKAFR
jgi:hypothetical protein